MFYQNIRIATFLERPNRFVANVLLDGRQVTCHVKNTGRCRELLVPGARVILQEQHGTGRKTDHDLIGVYKGDTFINMDSSAPNQVLFEWLEAGGLGMAPTLLKPEKTWGTSRFDFYLELGPRRIFIEAKGVTLEENGIARFPDAPTLRGRKHLQELRECVGAGYEAMVVFVIQMKGISWFEPNSVTDPDFSDALRLAHQSGVQLLALDCHATPDTLAIDMPVPIRL